MPNSNNITDEQKRSYQLWKARFASNISEYFKLKENEIETHYSVLIEKAAKSYPYATKTSEISLLLRKLLESGITISTTYGNISLDINGPGFTFIVGELLSPPSTEAESLFAQFRSELNHFAELGAEYQTEMQMINKFLTITYYIPVASFGIIKNQLEDVLDYYANQNDQSDYFKDNFEIKYKNNLEMFYNYIEEEILRYSCK